MRGVKKFSDEISLEDGGLDAGLLVLSAVTPPGVELTQEEIAFVCGCNRQDIHHIEHRARKKIKAEFEKRGFIDTEKDNGGFMAREKIDFEDFEQTGEEKITIPDGMTYEEIENKILAAIDDNCCLYHQIQRHAGFPKSMRIDGILNGMIHDGKIVKLGNGLNPTHYENCAAVGYFRCDRPPKHFALAGGRVECVFDDNQPKTEKPPKKAEANGYWRKTRNSDLFGSKPLPVRKQESQSHATEENAANPAGGDQPNILELRSGQKINLTEFEKALKEGVSNNEVAKRAGFRNGQQVIDLSRRYDDIREIYNRCKVSARGWNLKDKKKTPAEADDETVDAPGEIFPKRKGVKYFAAGGAESHDVHPLDELKTESSQTDAAPVEAKFVNSRIGATLERIEKEKNNLPEIFAPGAVMTPSQAAAKTAGAVERFHLQNDSTFIEISNQVGGESQHAVSVPFEQGGELNISLSGDANIFRMNARERAFINGLVDYVQGYEG